MREIAICRASLTRWGSLSVSLTGPVDCGGEEMPGSLKRRKERGTDEKTNGLRVWKQFRQSGSQLAPLQFHQISECSVFSNFPSVSLSPSPCRTVAIVCTWSRNKTSRVVVPATMYVYCYGKWFSLIQWAPRVLPSRPSRESMYFQISAGVYTCWCRVEVVVQTKSGWLRWRDSGQGAMPSCILWGRGSGYASYESRRKRSATKSLLGMTRMVYEVQRSALTCLGWVGDYRSPLD